MGEELWVLGATGRSGTAVVNRLVAAGRPVVAVGRDRGRLERLAGRHPDVRIVHASLDHALAAISAEKPKVVVHTVGPFARTARRVVGALPAGTHYVDLSNELPAVAGVLAATDRAAARGSTLVAGGGFGVLGTESVVVRLCGDGIDTGIGTGGRVPARVRTDAMAAVATDGGALGESLARTIVEGLGAGGRRVRDGAVVRARIGADAETLTTPDGDRVTTASFPSGELLAAWRASGAAEVVAASSEAPHGGVAALLSAVGGLTRLRPLRELAIRRLAALQPAARPATRVHSWAHARVTWTDGAVSEGWLRAQDGMDFTAAAAAAAARHLAAGDARPGAFTPAALFGPRLAEEAGGTFLDLG